MQAINSFKKLFGSSPQPPDGLSAPSSPSPTARKRRASLPLPRVSKAARFATRDPRDYQASPYPEDDGRDFEDQTDPDEDTDSESDLLPPYSNRSARSGADTAHESNLRTSVSCKLIQKSSEARAPRGSVPLKTLMTKTSLHNMINHLSKTGTDNHDDGEEKPGPSGRLVQKPPSVMTPSSPPRVTAEVETLPVPKEWLTMSIEEKWTHDANRQARTLLGVYRAHPNLLRPRIKRELKEPEYVLRDAEIRDGLWQVMDKMDNFAKKYFSFHLQFNPEGLSADKFEHMTPQTAKIIGCIASGGPAGVQGWHDLFFDAEKRQALVCGIIGNVLIEQVYQHTFFGGEVEHIEAMAAMQEEHQDADGKLTPQTSYTMPILTLSRLRSQQPLR